MSRNIIYIDPTIFYESNDPLDDLNVDFNNLEVKIESNNKIIYHDYNNIQNTTLPDLNIIRNDEVEKIEIKVIPNEKVEHTKNIVEIKNNKPLAITKLRNTVNNIKNKYPKIDIVNIVKLASTYLKNRYEQNNDKLYLDASKLFDKYKSKMLETNPKINENELELNIAKYLMKY